MSKKSIRFFNDREVRAVWDDENNKWWFSSTDIVRAINDEDDYKKCRNYWKYLKGKMAKDGVELVSVTNHFKFQAPDGKQRAADALDAECVKILAKPIEHPQVEGPVERNDRGADRPCLCAVQIVGVGLARSILPAHSHLLSQVQIVHNQGDCISLGTPQREQHQDLHRECLSPHRHRS